MGKTVADSFTAGEVVRLTSVPYKTLDYWATSTFIVPSIAQAAGVGVWRAYSFDDLVAVRVAVRLRAAGVSLQALRRVVTHLRARGMETPLANVFLVSDGHDVYERHGDELISTLRQPDQGAFGWVIDLGAVVEELHQAIAA
jgi:DNA-binding transcriptional MerR regulator